MKDVFQDDCNDNNKDKMNICWLCFVDKILTLVFEKKNIKGGCIIVSLPLVKNEKEKK